MQLPKEAKCGKSPEFFIFVKINTFLVKSAMFKISIRTFIHFMALATITSHGMPF